MKRFIFLAVASASACIINARDEKVVDVFSVSETPVTVWLEPGDVLVRNKKVLFESSKGNEITLSLQGNYKILSKE